MKKQRNDFQAGHKELACQVVAKPSVEYGTKPECSQSHAISALRQVVYRQRSALGKGGVIATDMLYICTA